MGGCGLLLFLQNDSEYWPLPERTFAGNLSFELFTDTFDDSKAQAGGGLATSRLGRYLAVLRKKMGQFVGLDTHPFIAYFDADGIFFFADAHPHIFPRGSVFDRIGQQVVQHTSQQLAVAKKVKGPVVAIQVEADILVGGDRSKIIQAPFSEDAQVEIFKL